MTDEDVLRRILQQEALTVNPEGSFDEVERRLRRTPRWLAPVAAAAALAVVVGTVALVAAQDGDTDVRTTPSTDVTTPTTTAPDPAPNEQATGEGVWPFTTGAEADAWAAANPNGAFFDPSETAVGFLQEYVGMTDPMLDDFAQGDSRSGEVVARTRAGGPETVVLLRLLGDSEVWTAIGAVTDTIRLEAPGPLETIDTPVQIRGESCCTFEGNVVIQVKEDGQVGSQEFLGQEPLIGGSMGSYEPLQGEVTFAQPSRPGGAVVAFTTSPEDGNVDRAAVVKVWFGTNGDPNPQAGALPAGEPLTDDQLVAVLGGPEVPSEGEHRLVVMDGTDGSVARELTTWGTAEGGILDVALTPDRRTILHTASSSACTAELHAISTEGNTDVRFLEGVITHPLRLAVHPHDGRVAISTDDDCDGQSELMVWRPYEDVGNTSRLAAQHWPDASPETGSGALLATVRSIAWVDDDTLALGMQYEDGVAVRLHELGDRGLEVGGGPDVEADDGASFDLPTTTEADGWVGIVRRCCGIDPSSNSILRRYLNPEVAESPPIEAPGGLATLGWRGDEWFWVTNDGQLLRSTGSAITAVADGVADFAL